MYKFIKNCIPPIAFEVIKGIRGGNITLSGDYDSWEEASLECSGYSDQNILKEVLESTLKVKKGEATFERDSVLFDEIEYAWPVLSGLMWSMARNKGRLNVLDFGGALGSSYFQNRKFLNNFENISWSVVEQEHYVLAGQKYIQDDYLKFYQTINDCLAENQPNVVLISGVLQYLPEPIKVLKMLASVSADTLILDRTPYVNKGLKPTIKIQTVPSQIYPARYPCRLLSEVSLIAEINELNYSLIKSFNSLDNLASMATWKGHIFRFNKS